MTRAPFANLILAVAPSGTDTQAAAPPDAAGDGAGKLATRPAALGDAGTAGAPVPEDRPAQNDAAPDRPPLELPASGAVGVEACDEYLQKMARCIGKLSPESQDTMRAGMEDSRAAWRETARSEEGKIALQTACRQALDAARSAAKAMGCEW